MLNDHTDVFELKALLDQQADVQLLDVREPSERQICTIPGDIHIRMAEIPTRYTELDPSKRTIVYCRSGQRSYQVMRFLQAQHFSDIKNLEGGILAWGRHIDPKCPSY